MQVSHAWALALAGRISAGVAEASEQSKNAGECDATIRLVGSHDHWRQVRIMLVEFDSEQN